jgi:hypothetical protein
MLRAACLCVAFCATSGAVYAEDFGIGEFRLGMSADNYVAAYHKYIWPTELVRASDAEKKKPTFRVNGITATYMEASTTDGYIEEFKPLPKHTKNLPIYRLAVNFDRKGGDTLRALLLDKYDADCKEWKPGVDHIPGMQWWCVYETADEKLMLSASDASVPENSQEVSLVIYKKHPRASLSGF